ncbi:MAG: fumarylacetoacetate hydrolase family protein [Proteobacteria bacterium]|nr:fumarylacetoacetate hydrolase family protein [Pseudomonadota bacterium]
MPAVPIRGRAEVFPVHRIYCVGRNFAEHAKEMGAAPSKPSEPPVFFMKPADAVVGDGTTIPYPRGTSELHHEVELVVALGEGSDGVVAASDALELVFGYSVGLDLTRRDLQARAKARGLPWDVAKGFDRSAPLAPIVPVTDCGHPVDAVISLRVNDRSVQSAPLAQMIFNVADVLHELSRLYDLRAGDLIFMGTPAGVGPLHPGDRYHAEVSGLATLDGAIGT